LQHTGREPHSVPTATSCQISHLHTLCPQQVCTVGASIAKRYSEAIHHVKIAQALAT